jgi:hypothetical protein
MNHVSADISAMPMGAATGRETLSSVFSFRGGNFDVSAKRR